MSYQDVGKQAILMLGSKHLEPKEWSLKVFVSGGEGGGGGDGGRCRKGGERRGKKRTHSIWGLQIYLFLQIAAPLTLDCWETP